MKKASLTIALLFYSILVFSQQIILDTTIIAYNSIRINQSISSEWMTKHPDFKDLVFEEKGSLSAVTGVFKQLTYANNDDKTAFQFVDVNGRIRLEHQDSTVNFRFELYDFYEMNQKRSVNAQNIDDRTMFVLHVQLLNYIDDYKKRLELYRSDVIASNRMDGKLRFEIDPARDVERNLIRASEHLLRSERLINVGIVIGVTTSAIGTVIGTVTSAPAYVAPVVFITGATASTIVYILSRIERLKGFKMLQGMR